MMMRMPVRLGLPGICNAVEDAIAARDIHAGAGNRCAYFICAIAPHMVSSRNDEDGEERGDEKYHGRSVPASLYTYIR